jgi:hypothetical protein
LDPTKEKLRISERFIAIIKEKGVMGLYRGIGPGLSRSIIANGPSMIIYNFC